ncbi:MAG TPA: proline--tRNA ligase [Acidimicrobiia bacterium]|nr:proline--tRNA ligase [Acidimicrobiia bacterium]
MRWSQAYFPTLRDDPAEAEAVSHKLLVRGGFIRQLSAGHYSMLPLGQRVRAKIDRIIREEMDAIGGQQFHLPALHPAEIWKKSGRWDVIGDELFRLKDRKGAESALGFTHEEVFATLATEISSYRDLPQIWYQVQTKFRDEPRPRSGLLRVREFTMKDSYSLDIDRQGLDVAFDKHHAAYRRIFSRIGVQASDVQASSGAMGGSTSVEFVVKSPAGEDWIVSCPKCDYRANLERAVSELPKVVDDGGLDLPEEFATPGIKTIAALAAAFPDIATPERQLKTLVFVLDGQITLAVVRGDHELLEQKLRDATGAVNLRVAQADEMKTALGAFPGSLGAVGVRDIPIVMDEEMRGRTNMVTGANRDDWHLRGVDVERDLTIAKWASLRTVREGEGCPNCGSALTLWKGIEVGHIFKLGTRYSEAIGALVQDEAGESHPIVMGSYGIGLERSIAAVVEACHDEKGIVWPVSVAPYEVVVTVLRVDDDATLSAGTNLYEALRKAGVDVVLDDRSERPGVKFADAELIGFPYRITVGPKGVAAGNAELTRRSGLITEDVPMAEVVDRVTQLIMPLRSGFTK